MEAAKLELICQKVMGIPRDELGYPTMPVPVIITEALTFATNIDDDSERFSRLRIDALMASDEIRDVVEALKHFQLKWQKEEATRSDSQKVWADNEEPAYELRDGVLDILDYFFEITGNVDGLKLVESIREGTGHADMLMDLSSMADTIEEHSMALDEEIGFDLDAQREVRDMADMLTPVFGASTADRKDTNESREMRDRMAIHLDSLMGRVRKAVKIIWRGNAEEQRKYRSEHRRRRYLKSLETKAAKEALESSDI
jgi:hypothetical protein